jgi:hypothetical protein
MANDSSNQPPPNDLDARLAKVEAQFRELSESVAKPKRKDAWDRLASISPFVSGVLIAGVGLYFTSTFQQRQIDINEADLAIKFFPHITSKDAEVRTQAFAVIQAVGGNLLIAKLAPIGGTAAEPVLVAASRNPTDAVSNSAVERALATVQEISLIQKKLGVVPDGVMGPTTRTAIAQFQKERGIPETGLVDSRTLELLRKEVDRSKP